MGGLSPAPETGFYYLQSRYYDPAIGRFINADSFASTGQGFQGYNMFAYCGNNPVNRNDPDGDLWVNILGALAIQYASDVLTNIAEGRTGWEIFEPRSTLATYTAAAVCSLIPGGSIENALTRSVATEAILWVDNILHGESSKNNIKESLNNIALNTVIDFGTGYILDNTLEKMGTKDYSTSSSDAIKSGSAVNLRQVYDNLQSANCIGRAIGSGLRNVYEIAISYFTS